MSDAINPSHYKHLPVEAIDIIEAAIAKAPSNEAACLHWQVLKYTLRCWEKNGFVDLGKAKWYLDRLVDSFDDLLAEINAPILEGESEEPKPSRAQPLSGYRLLGDAKVEPRIEGDQYWSLAIRGWTVLTSFKVEYANQENWPACRKIEPPSNNSTASLNSDKIPKGYRKLGDSSIEPRQLGDLHWSVSGNRYVGIASAMLEYANRDNWAACRKIEKPNKDPTASLNSDKIPKGYRKLGDSSIDPRRLGDLRWSVSENRYVGIASAMLEYANRDNWAACRKIEAPSKRYREPTLADLALGPIECEYRDDDGDGWVPGYLTGVIEPPCFGFRFRCHSLGAEKNWAQCRIEVQE